jgi:hypothetical protein
MRPADSFLDLARVCMCLRERPVGRHTEREEGDEPPLGLNEPELTRVAAGRLAHDPRDVLSLVALGKRERVGVVGERLQVRLDALDLR